MTTQLSLLEVSPAPATAVSGRARRARCDGSERCSSTERGPAGVRSGTGRAARRNRRLTQPPAGDSARVAGPGGRLRVGTAADWKLDERTREVGRQGLEAARRALAEAVARSSAPQSAA